MSASGRQIARESWMPGAMPSANPGWQTRAPASSLLATVSREVVPRLVLARRDADGAIPPAGLVPESAVAEFAALVLTGNSAQALAYAERTRADGLSLDSLYLDLLAPAARRLGTMWEDDTLSFTQVTIGLGRLHGVLRQFSPTFQSDSDATTIPVERQIILVPAPGEQHTFGLAMVTEFFRRGGWSVWSGVPASGPELNGILRDGWFAVIGFSLGSELRLDALRRAIRTARAASRNRRLRVMVGGPVFIAHPEYVAGVGADAMATDGRQAVRQAQALLTLLPTRPAGGSGALHA